MSKLFGLARIGRDVEIRRVPNGDAVANISLAFSYGRKVDGNNRPTQWVEASLWGKRAEALAPYLLKGGLISVMLEDVHIEVYKGKNGEASKLVGKVLDIELAGGGDRSAAPPQKPSAAPTQRPAPAIGGSGFDDMDDDIPFLFNMNTIADTAGTSKALLRAKYGKGLHILQVNRPDF